MARAGLMLIGLLAVLLVSTPLHADQPQSLGAPDRAAIVRVIRQQMDAFRRDDAEAAFAFAAPSIQGLFGHDPVRFMAMVRQGYAAVYRPRSTIFGEAQVTDGQVIERVEVQGPDGTPRTAIYTMERQGDGSWRISGCALLDAGAVGA